jgi:hypothetical protein
MSKKPKSKSSAKASKSGGSKSALPSPPAGEVLAKVTSFDIEAEKLPKAVADGAMRSGDFPYDEKYDETAYDDEACRSNS